MAQITGVNLISVEKLSPKMGSKLFLNPGTKSLLALFVVVLFFDSRSHCEAQANLELVILLSESPDARITCATKPDSY